MKEQTKRILIAEDSSEWQRFHAEQLRSYNKLNLEFDIASSARDALELAQQNINNPYDLILSDLQMETEFLPEFAGEWFVKNLKNIKEYENTPVVLISASYNIAFIASSLGVDYLSKRSIVSSPLSYFFMLDEHLL